MEPRNVGMEDDYYCEKHELKTPMCEDTGDPHCPYCRKIRLIRARRKHMITRDRTVEPW